MLQSLRLKIIEPLTVGGYLVLIVIGVYLHSRQAWIATLALSLIHISEPTRPELVSRMPSSA